MNHLQKRLCRRLLVYTLLIAAGTAAIILSVNGFSPPCVFYSNFHIICPSCGATRALLALLCLDFASAIELNPVFSLALYPIAGLIAAEDIAVSIHVLYKGRGRVSLLQYLCGWRELPQR